jgi:hypothetical protein
MLTGTTYINSGKFNPLAILLTLAVAGALAVFSGMLYAVITHINPIIYLNFLVLAGEVILLAVLISFSKAFGKSRNRAINLLCGVFICLTAWFAHWAFYMDKSNDAGTWNNLFHPGAVLNFAVHYADDHALQISRLGSGGLPISGGFLDLIYLIEFAAFMVPVYFAFSGDYYCENCNKYYSSKEVLIEEADNFRQQYNSTSPGNYSFVETSTFKGSVDALALDPANKPEVIKANYHFCEKCMQDSIIDFSSLTLQYTDKVKRELAKENTILKGMYIDTKTDQVFRQKLGIVQLPVNAM